MFMLTARVMDYGMEVEVLHTIYMEETAHGIAPLSAVLRSDVPGITLPIIPGARCFHRTPAQPEMI
jgi:hypothetical protein